MAKTYTELSMLDTFEERFDYLKLGGSVGVTTFGFERYLNQKFYTSTEWRYIRDVVIARDYGCDLGIDGFDIHDRIYIHHINPMTPDDVKQSKSIILNPEFLITTSHATHNAIHYGDKALLERYKVVKRIPGDTRLW